MANILLVEPSYRSKFPPLGLLKLSTYHKSVNDTITFTRGNNSSLRDANWNRIYISSLYTWEIPRTIKTIKYYEKSVSDKGRIIVGGVGASLLPDYIAFHTQCKVVAGQLDRKGKIDRGIPSLHNLPPDYGLLDKLEYPYKPTDSFFARATIGCIRNCKFCAVCTLEPKFKTIKKWWEQIETSRDVYGDRQNLVLLDNNILAVPNFDRIIDKIIDLGFGKDAKLNNRLRKVDFNQGIDARLINDRVASNLSTINVTPIRLALDYDAMIKPYTRAISILAKHGHTKYTNYVMYNYRDNPRSFYRRLKLNYKLARLNNISITMFPMRFVPIDDINRQYVSPKWPWRYLRGIQCILQATHGLVSPNYEFFCRAFGESYEKFIEIISMPDRYIMHRDKYENNEAKDWKKRFNRLSHKSRTEFLGILEQLNSSISKKVSNTIYRKFGKLIEHYYPDGKIVRE